VLLAPPFSSSTDDKDDDNVSRPGPGMTLQKSTLPSGAVPHIPLGEVEVSCGTPALARRPYLYSPPMEPLGVTSGSLQHPHPSFLLVVSSILLLYLVFLPSVRAEPGAPERGHHDPPSNGGVAAPPGAGQLPPPRNGESASSNGGGTSRNGGWGGRI